MKSAPKYQGIIFDMDNTLLQSRIDLLSMKKAVFAMLAAHGFYQIDYQWADFTVSQLIDTARASVKMTKEIEAAIWETVIRYEKEGMHNAALEPGVAELLLELDGRCLLTVLTNNALTAAMLALQKTEIAGYFDLIVGREMLNALKPSPAGVYYILNKFPRTSPAQWLFVGDSWIDGKAAQGGQVDFLAYQGNEAEMARREVYPLANLTDIRHLLNYL
jgi:phosphoglycolate phosphatase